MTGWRSPRLQSVILLSNSSLSCTSSTAQNRAIHIIHVTSTTATPSNVRCPLLTISIVNFTMATTISLNITINTTNQHSNPVCHGCFSYLPFLLFPHCLYLLLIQRFPKAHIDKHPPQHKSKKALRILL